MNIRKLTLMITAAKKICHNNNKTSAILEALENQIRQQSRNDQNFVQQHEILRLREELLQDKELNAIFDLIWYTLRPMVERDTYELSREGYIKFSILFHCVVGGDIDEAGMTEAANTEYMSTTSYFGHLTKDIFFDALGELIGKFIMG